MQAPQETSPRRSWKGRDWRAWIKTAWRTFGRRNLIIFVAIFSILIFIDMLTKGLIYDGNRTAMTGVTQANWGFLGFRSQFHTSTTFLDFIGAKLPHWASLLINYTLITIFIFLVALSRNKWRTAALTVIFAGIIGNTIDATYWGGVRNVLFIPYNDRGTFNFADFFIFLGAGLVVLTFVIEIGRAFWQKRQAARRAAAPSSEEKTTSTSD